MPRDEYVTTLNGERLDSLTKVDLVTYLNKLARNPNLLTRLSKRLRKG